MKRIIVTGASLVLCLFVGSIWNHTQAKDPWQRVYTGDGTIIELNSMTLRFGSANLLRAHFRTVFSNAESIPGDRGQKYKTRLETIDFRLTDRKYRFVEISLLDSGGKPIQTQKVDASEDWRVLKPGGITERLFTAACSFTPLGSWKVISYRFAEGDPKETKNTRDLDRLIGASVYLNIDSAAVGSQVCYSPSFQDKDPIEDESLRHLAIDWKSIGIKREDARTIDVRCGGEGWQTRRSLLVKDQNKEEMLMLWDGVFLVLRRSDGGAFRVTPGNGRRTLKRREP